MDSGGQVQLQDGSQLDADKWSVVHALLTATRFKSSPTCHVVGSLTYVQENVPVSDIIHGEGFIVSGTFA